MNFVELLLAGAMDDLQAAIRAGQDINEAGATLRSLFPSAPWQSINAVQNLWINQKAQASQINAAGPTYVPQRSDIPVNPTIGSPYLYSGYVTYRLPEKEDDWQVYVEIESNRLLDIADVTAASEEQIAGVIHETLGGRYGDDGSAEITGYRLTAIVRRTY